MSYPTVTGDAVEGVPYREAQSCLGPALGAGASYQFFLSGTSTPANVYQDGALTTPFPITGFVSADSFGRFPPIYLDTSVIYRVQFYDSTNTLRWQVDPYTPLLATVGTSALVAYGFQVAPTGEVVLDAPASGGTGITLTLKAGSLGSAALEISAPLPGASAIIINSSATTGTQTATFNANNKPGTPPTSYSLTLTAAPSGATYTGGTLSPAFTGPANTNYTVTLSTGQNLYNVTLNGPTLSVASTVITGSPTTAITAITPVTPAGWLPITCDGVQYYTPIWHGNNFSPYVANPTALGEMISANTVTFTGTGLTTATGGTAVPGSWYVPNLTNVGAGYYINITKTNGLSGLAFVEDISTVATAAPSGATYVGGTLTSAYTGNTASNYTVILSTGQVITGCTFTNGSTAFTTPSTNVTGTPNTILTVSIDGVWANITSGGLTISNNAVAQINGTYQLSTSASGNPVVASGTINLNGTAGVNNPTWNGATPLVLAGNGTTTLNGGASTNWFLPTTANVGASYWINITQTGGTAGYSFSAAAGAWTNITNGGLSIGVSGSGAVPYSVTGTYLIASDSGGVNRLGSGTITLTGGSDVQSPNWSGTTPLNLRGNGSATLNGFGTSNWYSPTTANVGAGYYINLTRTGGTSGVNFSVAQGSWTIISNTGRTIDMTGYTGDVGTATVSGTYQISSSVSGTPVLGSGTLSLSVAGLTVIHVYTSPVTSATETIPTGTTNVFAEVWGSGGGGGGSQSGGGGFLRGGNGGCGGFSYSVYTTSGLGGVGKTFKYTVAAGGAAGSAGGGNGSAGAAGTIVAGTVTGFTTMTANGGALGTGATGSAAGNPGAGGTATGGNNTNTTGTAGSAIGTNGKISGDGSPYGGGGSGGNISGGNAGSAGAAVFYYT